MDVLFSIDNYISIPFFEDIYIEMIRLFLPSGFAFASILILLTFGLFKALTLFKSFT